MTTDTEIIERYFKARGFTWGLCPALLNPEGKDEWRWRSKKDNYRTEFEELPKILTDYPAFKEQVLEVMGEEGYRLDIHNVSSRQSHGTRTASWVNRNVASVRINQEIKNEKILHAAVVAATRYFEGKK